MQNFVGKTKCIVGYMKVADNHFISNKDEWNNCFHNSTKRKILNLAHYFPYDVKLRLLAHSRSFLANQKARNAIVEPENLLIIDNKNVSVF